MTGLFRGSDTDRANATHACIYGDAGKGPRNAWKWFYTQRLSWAGVNTGLALALAFMDVGVDSGEGGSGG